MDDLLKFEIVDLSSIAILSVGENPTCGGCGGSYGECSGGGCGEHHGNCGGGESLPELR